jgi:hypothetical protein
MSRYLTATDPDVRARRARAKAHRVAAEVWTQISAAYWGARIEVDACATVDCVSVY